MIAIVPHDMASTSLMIGRKGSQFTYLPLEPVKLRIQLHVLFFQTYCLLNCSGFSSLSHTIVPCRELVLVMVQSDFVCTRANFTIAVVVEAFLSRIVGSAVSLVRGMASSAGLVPF
jgi:hypothetical protein